jgi:hypothetical protein
MNDEKPRLKRDWEGRYVRLLREVKNNGGDVAQAGTVMRVTRSHGGLTLTRVAYCECCGIGTASVFRKVSERAVELVPINTGIDALLPERVITMADYERVNAENNSLKQQIQQLLMERGGMASGQQEP